MTPVGSGLSPENAAANHATYDQSSPALREAPGTGDEEQLREKLHRDERFREEQERMQGLSQSAAEAESVGLLPGAASSFASASLGSSSFGSATEGSSVQGSLATTSSVQGSLAPGSSVQGSGSLVQGSVVRGGTSTLYNSLTDSQWPVAESVGESLGAVENLGTVSVTEPVAEFHDVAESPAQLRFASDVQDEGMGQAESSEPAGAKVGEFYTVPSFRQHMKEGLTTRSREMLDRIFGASLEDATLDFVTFEQTVVSQVWGLSNYMSCCLYSMIKGISLTEISETVHAITAAVDVHVASGYLVRRSELEKFWVENQLSLSEGYVWNLFAVIRAASRKSRPDGSGQAVTDVTDEGGSQGQVSQTEDGAGGSGAGGSVEKSNSVSKSASLLSYFEDEEVVNIKDFYPFLCELVLRHKPVEFLRTYTEFQKRLCDTTSYKLAFDLWGSVDGDITYTRFGASCLADTWYYISSSQHEMSQVRDFFSYEQFYVVYCLFYALDADKDGTIDRQDLIKYNSYAYSDLVINRITQESGPEYFDSHGRMNFNGFLKFVLIDEDKTTDQAIEYWFRIVDLDGDGYIRQYEIDNFYQDQQARLTSRSLDAPSVDVIHSQISDMIRPQVPFAITVRDIKKQRRHAPLFFNSLLNMTKFVLWEHRDPFISKAEILDYPLYTDWERWCRLEYDRIAGEEAQNGGDAASGGSDVIY
ncbi:EF hand protein [Gregarina niphandrodes]|uniref:EF hand protein n=1 Tax=Gregarina niphandrodes TaxID=110365 RepID=A0A023BCA0_GRENI|nr:EF hand protein [Gregarina niphandrodes]EZG83322.1 EF hand protein [Gregarina niphandrodes]|eukprot:XP_011128946.1 EF hand protein [Gregarina niphandrodes]